jgi:hypothetical protein
MMIVEFGGKRALLQNIKKLGSPFRIMSKVNLNLLIDEATRQDFKAACAKNGTNMTNVLLDCIFQYVVEYLKNEEVQSSTPRQR